MKFEYLEYISPLQGDIKTRKSVFERVHNKQFGFALDSNVFRNQDFSNYLIFHKEHIQFFLPSIVQAEVGYYYRAKGLSWEDFITDLNDFECILLSGNIIQIPELIEIAYMNKTNLPFREHFRDYMIGLECKSLGLPLITSNIRHFQWSKLENQTPEEFVKKFPIEFQKK